MSALAELDSPLRATGHRIENAPLCEYQMFQANSHCVRSVKRRSLCDLLGNCGMVAVSAVESAAKEGEDNGP